MKELFIDIECVKTQRADFSQRIADTIKPDGRYKKAETILKWEQEEKPQAILDAIEKTVFNGGLCHITQLQFALNDGDIAVHQIADVAEEKLMLEQLFAGIQVSFDQDKIKKVVGHNIIGFDLLVLKQRAIVLGLKLPDLFRLATQNKTSKDFCFDTMIEWGGYKDFVSMDNLCYYLGVETPKGEVNGANFGEHWEQKHFELLKEYGHAEIKALREVYRAMTI